ncbi:glutaredoxin [Aphanomyces invadans]|uniref:Glutaredoxin n=1 Tax=Aphanomyces invadans TaxID=157072 RepID=A0A024TZ85_9STRA|nr:glutaredoxin [Aphanomyces invadans]ETV98677.1 glutaredoxin [Aphanomyces invadans]|eukprot:XP_008872874.1 glutaredoxin [Aphanomyces invadans]
MVSKAAQEFVEATIAANTITVFTTAYCPYCTLAKQVLSGVGAEYSVIDVDSLPNGNDVMDVLEAKTGRATVPNVFVKGMSIGGGSDVDALHKQGKLIPLLQEAGAL